jgi:hypothetical protein
MSGSIDNTVSASSGVSGLSGGQAGQTAGFQSALDFAIASAVTASVDGSASPVPVAPDNSTAASGADASQAPQQDAPVITSIVSDLMGVVTTRGADGSVTFKTALSDGELADVRSAAASAVLAAIVANSNGGAAKVAEALERFRGVYASNTPEDAVIEQVVAAAAKADPSLLDGFAAVQLDIVKANGATLTPYQEGVFLQRFKELVPAQTIDEARANALLAAQAAPANPPGTNPDGQVNRGNFNLDNALFVLSPSGYRSEPAFIDSQGNSFQSFIRNGGNDDNPYSMEISSYTLINGELSEGGASTTLDDGSYATVRFRANGSFTVNLPNGERYSDTGWYDDITDPDSAYRGVASPSDPLSIYRFKALTEGTTPPAMPSAPPATSPPATPPALPAPVLPPGVEPGNDKGLGGASYPAANAQEAVRIALELISGQALGTFAVVMYNPDSGEYWVDGPYPGSAKPADVAGRYPAPFRSAAVIIATPDTPVPTTPPIIESALPEPQLLPVVSPNGKGN